MCPEKSTPQKAGCGEGTTVAPPQGVQKRVLHPVDRPDGAGDTGAQEGCGRLSGNAQVLKDAAALPYGLESRVKDGRNELRVLVAVHAQVAGKLRKASHHPGDLRARLNRQLAAQLGRARTP